MLAINSYTEHIITVTVRITSPFIKRTLTNNAVDKGSCCGPRWYRRNSSIVQLNRGLVGSQRWYSRGVFIEVDMSWSSIEVRVVFKVEFVSVMFARIFLALNLINLNLKIFHWLSPYVTISTLSIKTLFTFIIYINYFLLDHSI